MDIAEIRAEIDAIDDQMSTCFERRMRLALLIAEIKKAQGLAVLSQSREQKIVDRLTQGRCEIDAMRIKRLYATVFDISRDAQSAYMSENSHTDKRNIALIGMPGCGKSMAGQALAELLTMDFFDTDDEITRRTGMTPSEWIVDRGENVFREMEQHIVRDACKNVACVIATGGGSVLLEENRRALMHSAVIVYLRRPLDELTVEDRPLSVNLVAMFAVRRPIYESLSHIAVDVLPCAKSTALSVSAALDRQSL